MTKEQIEYMRDRFLQWKLPPTFNPDWSMRSHPTGTNLLDATQAEKMIRYMLDGLPDPAPTEDPKNEPAPAPIDPIDGMTLVAARERWKWERDILAPVKAQCERYENLAWKWMERADQLMDKLHR